MSIGFSNPTSEFIKRSLSDATAGMALHMQRLSSGLKINSAGDDAAGLGLSQKLKVQLTASDIAKTNTQTGVNLLQVADGDYSAMGDIMSRMRDLAVQSASGVYSVSERTALNSEFTTLKTEIDRIANVSSFSGINLLSATSTVTLQIGTGNTANDRLAITLNQSLASNFGIVAGTLVDSQANAQTAMGTLDTAISTLATYRSSIGASINTLTGNMQRMDLRKENLSSANSIIEDANIATESAGLSKNQIRQQASATLLQQANQMPAIALTLIK